MLANLDQIRVATSLHWSDDFTAWLQENDRMAKTVQAYLQDLRHFSKFFEQVNGQPFTPDQLNATDVKAYFAAQDADHSVAPTSRNRRLSALRVVVKWAAAMGILEYDPTISIKRQRVELTPRDRNLDEMSRLNDVAQRGQHIRCTGEVHGWLALRDHVLWALFTDTGMRIHEIAALEVDDLDFNSLQIHVLGKGGKKAPINVSTALMDLLASWLDLRPGPAQQAVVVGPGGTRLTTGQIRRRIQMIGNAAGVRGLKPHDLRHTYAYRLSQSLINEGLNPEKAKDGVRKQLRHGDSKTTDLYFRVRDSEIRAAVEAM